MAYDPRTATGIPTEPVGSLPPAPPPRQSPLREVRTTGEASREDLLAAQERGGRGLPIERGAATGAPIISDGEQRAASFATYPLADTLAGTGLSRQPGRRQRPFFGDLRRWAPPPAAPD